MKVNKEYPNRLRLVGIGLEELGYEEFLKEGYFQSELYVNKGKTIYKAMNFSKPGCLTCWGFCKKDVFKRLKNIEENFKEKKLKTDMVAKSDQFQMGGSIMITPSGNVIFQHQDSYYGDHAKEEVIMEMINNYFGNENANNNGNREIEETEKLSGRN